MRKINATFSLEAFAASMDLPDDTELVAIRQFTPDTVTIAVMTTAEIEEPKLEEGQVPLTFKNIGEFINGLRKEKCPCCEAASKDEKTDPI